MLVAYAGGHRAMLDSGMRTSLCHRKQSATRPLRRVKYIQCIPPRNTRGSLRTARSLRAGDKSGPPAILLPLQVTFFAPPDGPDLPIFGIWPQSSRPMVGFSAQFHVTFAAGLANFRHFSSNIWPLTVHFFGIWDQRSVRIGRGPGSDCHQCKARRPPSILPDAATALSNISALVLCPPYHLAFCNIKNNNILYFFLHLFRANTARSAVCFSVPEILPDQYAIM